MASMHRGARLFTLSARRAVADGPLFNRQIGRGGAFVREDGCCVVGALLQACEVVESDGVRHRVPDAGEAFRLMTGRDRDTITPLTPEVGDLIALMDKNDEGEFTGERGRSNLRRALLGKA